MKLLLGLLLISGVAQADYSGVIYEMGSGKAKKLYDIAVKTETAGDQETVSATITGTDGKVALTEKTVTKGNEVITYEIDHKQLESSAKIDTTGEKIKFTKTTGGKNKEDTEKKAPTFVITGNFQKFIASKWTEIMSGKPVSFRYGVWDRMETVGFDIIKTGDEGEGANKRVNLKMKPSSMIIAALVNPLDFKFSGDGKRLHEMKGRVGPKQQISGKWRDLDGEVVYSY